MKFNRPQAQNTQDPKKATAPFDGPSRDVLPSRSENGRGLGSVMHHRYLKSQPVSVGIFLPATPLLAGFQQFFS